MAIRDNSALKALLKQKKLIVGLIAALLLIASCSSTKALEQYDASDSAAQLEQAQKAAQSALSDEDDDVLSEEDAALDDQDPDDSSISAPSESDSTASTTNSSSKSGTVKNGVPSVLKGNWEPQSNGLYYTSDQDPAFSASLKKKTKSFEDYSSLDEKGRCGAATACIGLDIMPTEGRGSISEIKPTGWHTYTYDFINNGGYLYNRCHLIAFSLAGENANARNLITGTRQMNEAMIMFENIVYTYVTGTGNHCLYRVTPIFLNDELVARGVQMEAYSVEDNGAKVKFNVYLPNKQDKVKIDYSTGESSLKSSAKSSSSSSKSTASSKSAKSSSSKKSTSSSKSSKSTSSKETTTTYVLNTSSKKFHYPDCSAVKRMADHNKSTVKKTRSQVISDGYDPCGICHP